MYYIIHNISDITSDCPCMPVTSLKIRWAENVSIKRT